jgi:hypothetical protein
MLVQSSFQVISLTGIVGASVCFDYVDVVRQL